ncbi:MAG: hypothetical protein ABH827_04010 [bacterium]
MNLNEFLKEAKEQSFWATKKTFCFQGESYPYMFFFLLFRYLERKNILSCSIKKIAHISSDYDQLCMYLNQCILGQYSFYWLGDISEAKAAAQKKIIDLLINYQGPNTALFFLSSETKLVSGRKLENNQFTRIDIKTTVTFLEFKSIAVFFGYNFSSEKYELVKRFFAQSKELQLDFVCFLCEYLELINVKFADEFFIYLSAGISAEPSLFQLSEYFFGSKPQQFFKLWALIKDSYSDMFWLAFWSEQFWQAYHVTKCLYDKDFVQARRVGYRLPHSYIDRDYKRVNVNYLTSLHQFLYDIDFAFKKGTTFSGALDLMYCKHFLTMSISTAS